MSVKRGVECCFRVRVRGRVFRVRLGLFRVRLGLFSVRVRVRVI